MVPHQAFQFVLKTYLDSIQCDSKHLQTTKNIITIQILKRFKKMNCINTFML